MNTIIFDKKLKSEILNSLNKSIKDGLIVEKGTNEPVLTKNGEFIKSNELGLIKKGSQIFIKNDIVSLIDYIENR